MRSPILTVGMPVRNGARWIDEAMASILSQRFADLELVVSDNASTDQTEDIVRAAAERDPRVRYVRQPENIGPYRNHDDVLALARGRYFKWASSSDICLDGFFEQCVSILESRSDVVLAYPKTQLIVDQHGRREDYDDNLELDIDGPARRFARYLDRVRLNSPFHGIARHTAFAGTALNLPLPGSDISLMAEVTLRGKFVEVPERLLVRRFTAETTDLLKPIRTQGVSHRQASRRGRVQLHLARFAIPARAPISAAERRRVYMHLVARTVRMGLSAVRGVTRRMLRTR